MTMGKISAGRVILGGIVAGVICFLGDGVVHGILLKDRWAEIMTAMGKNAGDIGRQHPGYFLAYDLLKGLLAVWLYAAACPRFGPGLKTALLAAFTIWLLVIPIPTIGLLPMAFFSAGFVILWSLYGLVPIVIGTMIGAWLYRDASV
jgi:hypothetical protein